MSKLAFLFPGQGSQSLGMLAELAPHFSVIQETFNEASDVLHYDLWELTQSGPADKLNETKFTQPALLAAGLACFRAWREAGGAMPSMLAGHSLGEYTALVCAESLSFQEGILLVQKRGEFMQAAVPQGIGAMAAVIGLELDALEAICTEVAEGQVIAPANLNSPGQIVMAGHKEAVERACILAKERKARMTVMLPVSVPSHCDLMRPAAKQLEEAMQAITFLSPKIPVYHNVDVRSHIDSDSIKQALLTQLYSPVRWTETVQAFIQQAVTMTVECGPGNVLSGLNKRIDPALKSFSLGAKEGFDAVLADKHGEQK